jgi:hypothetical protein
VHIAQIKCHPGVEELQLLLCVKGIENVELALRRQIIELVEIWKISRALGVLNQGLRIDMHLVSWQGPRWYIDKHLVWWSDAIDLEQKADA